MNSFNKIARILFWSLIIIIFIRTFIFQLYTVPTPSMRETLKEGDVILVDKLAYGPRIPISLVGIPFTDISIENLQLPYFRLPGFSHIKKGDIVVFNYPLEENLPIDLRQPYVKRCIGLPGDTLRIIVPDDSIPYSPVVFPNNAAIKWTTTDFGPLYIPQKGKTIVLSSNNIILYKRVITIYEENKLTTRNDSVFVNDQYSSSYTFKMDYYFMAGDNHANSIDSRFWGFVPDDHIIGRVSQ